MSDKRFDGAKLRAAREELGLTSKELAARTNVSWSFVKYVESGHSQPGPLYAAALAGGVGLAVRHLMSEVTDGADATLGEDAASEVA